MFESSIEANSIIQNTIEDIQVIKDEKDIYQTLVLYSDGSSETVTIDNKKEKIIVEDSYYTIIDEYNLNDIISYEEIGGSIYDVIEDEYGISTCDTGNWYYKWNTPKTNLEASYMRVSAVISLVMGAVKIPYAGAYAIVSCSYQFYTGKTLPTVFGYIAEKWEYDSYVYSDLNNSSNGKVVFHYYWKGAYKNCETAYFKW